MNYTQNRKIAQVTETTLVVGVDIGSQWHYARELRLQKKHFGSAMTWMDTQLLKNGSERPLKTLLRWKCSLAVNLQGITGIRLRDTLVCMG